MDRKFNDTYLTRLVRERIIELREKDNNISQRELSLSLGANGSYINFIENKKSAPSLQMVEYIADYFGLTVHEFLFPRDNEINSVISKPIREFANEILACNNSDLIKELLLHVKDLDEKTIKCLIEIISKIEK